MPAILTLLTRITASHEVMMGKPVVRGTRLTVELLLRKMAEGTTAADLPRMYPQLEMADVETLQDAGQSNLSERFNCPAT